MEVLEKLGELNSNFTPRVSKDVFIRTIKEHKEAITPYVNCYISCVKATTRIELDPYFSLLYLATCVICSNDEDLTELVRFVLTEFRDFIDINRCGNVHHIRVHIVNVLCAENNLNACMLVATHPDFDVSELVHFGEVYENQGLIERIIARADPRKYKPLEDRRPVKCELLKRYSENPVKVHKEMLFKHFKVESACQIFVFTLLIRNKYLQT